MPTPPWPTIYAPRSHLDLLLELRGAIASEWWVPAQQQVGDDPDAPHVARSREVGAADHLRRHVHLSPKIEYNRTDHTSERNQGNFIENAYTSEFLSDLYIYI